MRSGTQEATIAVAFLQRRAICESARGNYHTAQQLFGAALRGLGRRGPTRRLLLLWNELGMVCKYLGKSNAAQKFYLRALRHAGRGFQGLDSILFSPTSTTTSEGSITRGSVLPAVPRMRAKESRCAASRRAAPCPWHRISSLLRLTWTACGDSSSQNGSIARLFPCIAAISALFIRKHR